MGLLLVRAALIAAAVLAFLQALPLSNAPRQAFGREMLSEHELPVQDVRRYGAQIGATGQPAAAREPWAVGSMWLGPVQGLGVGRNPYTLVLKVSGTARAAGNVRTHWQAGWEVHETATAVREMIVPMTGLSSGTVSAGAPVSLTIPSGAMSFRGERRGAPMVNLVAAHNIDIEAVTLQIWSGPAPSAVVDTGWMRPALVLFGLACLGGFVVMHRAATAAPAFRATASRPAMQDAPDSRFETMPGAPSQPAPAAAAVAFAAPALPAAAHKDAIDGVSVIEGEAPPLAPEPPFVPVAVAATPASPAERVVASLRDVLSRGLSVATEPDLSRRRPRASRRHRTA